MYIISGEITPDKISRIINDWKIKEKPRLQKAWDYYIGNQDINKRTSKDPEKILNKVTTNYCHNIVQNYLGFNVGQPVDFIADDKVIEFLKYSDVDDKNNRLLRDALVFGYSYELSYVDELKINRFDIIDPRYGIEVYKESLENDELKAFIRLYCDEYINAADNNWKIDVYDSKMITTYSAYSDFNKIKRIDQRAHNFKQVPVVVFNLNQERQGIFEQIIPLQDASNSLVSDQIDNEDALADAYMVIKGLAPDEDVAKQIKQDKIMFMDTDASAEYLIKNVNDSHVKNMIDHIEDSIYRITNCPDFNDPSFRADSGVAMEYKLVGFSNVSKAIMNRFERALRKRIELFQEINYIKTGNKFTKVKIVFHQNLPDNMESIARVANQLRGILSEKTLLSMIPVVENVDEELKNLKEQAESEYDLFKVSTGVEK